ISAANGVVIGGMMPNSCRVIACLPELPAELRQATGRVKGSGVEALAFQTLVEVGGARPRGSRRRRSAR
ncbi:MAG: hypothetical protein ACREJ5_28630, partial [Geminicoccaceae bacterium]